MVFRTIELYISVCWAVFSSLRALFFDLSIVLILVLLFLFSFFFFISSGGSVDVCIFAESFSFMDRSKMG